MTLEQARLRILYEDSRGQESQFPLHRLVLAAAHDLCAQIGRWQLEQRAIAIPKKGCGAVLKELGRARRHLDAGVCLLAWLDDDHVRDASPDWSRLSLPR